MCGIAGFWSPAGLDRDSAATLKRMTDAIRHRGPDDEGQWLDPDAGIALGHRRLSILDLSPEGHQPMVSAGGRYVIIYNGEIYNWRDLRKEEEAHGARWRGHSDTEVLLAAIERRGLVAAVTASSGMFAFALWDRQERSLHLVRDRLGEKPLYYGWNGNALLFGSELKALRPYPGWGGQVDRGAVTLLLRYGYIPAPWSIYDGIRKVEPGTILTWRGSGPGAPPEVVTYWSAREAAAAGLAAPHRGTPQEIESELDTLLRQVVAREMVADVPLGAFLSGGIDSTLIVALMQAQSAQPVHTFSIGFHEAGFDEAGYARAVAMHLGTDHTELYVTPAEAMAVVPKLPAMFDEPFADSSQIPTHLVAALARRNVTVSLSGDGGDELFGGYTRYTHADRIWQSLRHVPVSLRAVGGRVMRSMASRSRSRGGRFGGDRLRRLAALAAAPDLGSLHRRLVSHWGDPGQVVVGGSEPPTVFRDPLASSGLHPCESLMALDAVSYLPDDILVKVDRATMAVSLESRAPFLDHAVFEFAWRLPLRERIAGAQLKLGLKRILGRYLPATLFERPKQGFGVPIGRWLRGPLREWAEELLNADALAASGVLEAGAIRSAWTGHSNGQLNLQHQLWDVLMFQAWWQSQA